jgi:hypothetical protein
VQFVVNNKNFGKPVILSNNTASISDSSLPQGTYPVSANYLGDTDCQESSGTLTGGQTVLLLGTISLASSSNPSVFGQSVTLTATVTGSGATPTGTVTFSVTPQGGHTTQIGSATLSNGSGAISLSTLPVGSDSITVYYSGDKNYILCSAVFSQTVTPGTQTSVVSSLNPSVYGQSVTFMATVYGFSSGTPTGTVQFVADQGTAQQTVLGNPSLSPSQGANLAYATVTTSSLSAGNHTITANYSGDSTFAKSSGTCNQTVKALPPTTTSVVSSANPSTYGQSVTFTATVTGSGGTPTGTVTFLDGTSTIGTGTLSGGSTSIQTSSLSAGNHSITANYSGDSNFASSAGTLPGGQTVNRTTSTTTVSSSPNPSTVNSTVTFTATVTGSGGTPSGTVQFVADQGTAQQTVIGTATLSGGSASIQCSSLTVGIHTITANYSGDTNFASSTGTLPGGQTVYGI